MDWNFLCGWLVGTLGVIIGYIIGWYIFDKKFRR